MEIVEMLEIIGVFEWSGMEISFGVDQQSGWDLNVFTGDRNTISTKKSRPGGRRDENTLSIIYGGDTAKLRHREAQKQSWMAQER